jgi:PAS domain-containing protein
MGEFTELQRDLLPAIAMPRARWVAVPEERRHRPRPDTLTGYLGQLPDGVLLNRMPMPMLAVANHGIIVFANPACQVMLGDPDTTITGRPLNHFLQVDVATASESVTALRQAAGKITTWQPAHEEIIKVVVSQPLLMRAEDPILLVGLTDVTEWLWTTGPEAPDAPAINIRF